MFCYCWRRCSCNLWQTCFDCCLACSPREVCLGESGDQVCFFWQQNQLKAFELQPCSHSPKDLNEGKVMTLRMGIISRELWAPLLQGLRSLVAAVSWRDMGRAGSSWCLVLSWSETYSLGLYLHRSASISPSGEWKSLYFSWCSDNMNKMIGLIYSPSLPFFPQIILLSFLQTHGCLQ